MALSFILLKMAVRDFEILLKHTYTHAQTHTYIHTYIEGTHTKKTSI